MRTRSPHLEVPDTNDDEMASFCSEAEAKLAPDNHVPGRTKDLGVDRCVCVWVGGGGSVCVCVCVCVHVCVCARVRVVLSWCV
jgi:hypothetical protein